MVRDLTGRLKDYVVRSGWAGLTQFQRGQSGGAAT